MFLLFLSSCFFWSVYPGYRIKENFDDAPWKTFSDHFPSFSFLLLFSLVVNLSWHNSLVVLLGTPHNITEQVPSFTSGACFPYNSCILIPGGDVWYCITLFWGIFRLLTSWYNFGVCSLQKASTSWFSDRWNYFLSKCAIQHAWTFEQPLLLATIFIVTIVFFTH